VLPGKGPLFAAIRFHSADNRYPPHFSNHVFSINVIPSAEIHTHFLWPEAPRQLTTPLWTTPNCPGTRRKARFLLRFASIPRTIAATALFNPRVFNKRDSIRRNSHPRNRFNSFRTDPPSTRRSPCPVIPLFHRGRFLSSKRKKLTHPQSITSKNKKKMLFCRLIQPIRAQSQQIDFSFTSMRGEGENAITLIPNL
jgi:hypothetical protein